MDAPLSPAIIRLYGRARELECKVDEDLDAAEPVGTLLARCKGGDRAWQEYERAQAKMTRAILANHREYQWLKAELGQLLGLNDGDVHPLDLDYDAQDPSPEDPRFATWQRASELRYRLDVGYVDSICWWQAAPTLRAVSTTTL